jgi:hypothetical protein
MRFKIEKTKSGWRLPEMDPPLELSQKDYPTENAVRLWLGSTPGQEYMSYRTGRVALAKKVKTIHHRAAFAEDEVGKEPEAPVTEPTGDQPGKPADPEAPKPAESMEGFMERVNAAIMSRGWNAFENPDAQWDFMVTETFTDFVIVQDFKTSKTYKLSVTDSGEAVTLGEPEEYEVTYTKSGGGDDDKPKDDDGADDKPEEGEPDTAKMSRSKVRIRGKAVVLSSKGKDTKGNPKYEMLLCQSGETDDGRYVTDDCVRNAVAAGLWDGVRSYLSHPDPDTGKRTSEIACALVVPKTVRAENNDTGNVDAIADVVVFNTQDGKDVAEALDMGLEYGVAVIGTSVFSESAFKRRGEINGKNYETIVEKFEHIDAQDFVDDPAFSRAIARGRVAASLNGNGDELTMTEREELVELRKKTAQLQREKDVAAELAKSGLDEEDQSILEPLLLKQDDADVRKSMIALQRRNMLRSGKRAALSGGPQDGDGGSDDEPNYAPDLKAALDKNAKAFGIKPETLAKVRRKRSGQTAEA